MLEKQLEARSWWLTIINRWTILKLESFFTDFGSILMTSVIIDDGKIGWMTFSSQMITSNWQKSQMIMVKWNLGITKFFPLQHSFFREHDGIWSCGWLVQLQLQFRRIQPLTEDSWSTRTHSCGLFFQYPYHMAEKNSCKENPCTRPADPEKIYG